jgi:hypothetical protein
VLVESVLTVSSRSEVLSWLSLPLCVGPWIWVTVPPYTRSVRPTPEAVSAPATESPLALDVSDGNGNVLPAGSAGLQSAGRPPPPVAHRSTLSVASTVARKSYASWPPSLKS